MLTDWLRRRWRPAPPPAPPLSPLDFTAPDVVQDPYPYFARLRREEPVHRGAGGAWLIARHADVQAALADPRLSNAPAPYAVIAPRNRTRYLCAEVAGNTLPFIDGARHAALRRTLAQAWAAQLRETPPDIDAHARRLWAACPARGQFDLLHDFATPLAVTVIGEVLGVPVAAREALQADARHFLYLFTAMPSHAVREATDAALGRLRHGFAHLLDGAAGPGLIRRLGGAAAQTPDREVLLDNLALLWADCIGNVDVGIAAAFAALLRHPEQWQALCAQPDLSPAAAGECLRFEAPAQFIGRVVQEDFDWHGQTLRRGQAVLLLLASANRDENRFPAADRLDIRRPDTGALSFGRGHHSCLGAALARGQLAAALQSAAELTPRLHLTQATVQWQVRPGHRWPHALPVTVP